MKTSDRDLGRRSQDLVLADDGSVGRSAEEVLRILSALQTGELCRAGWRPGLATLGLAA